MKLNYALISEDASVDSEQRLTIINTFNEIKSDNFPAVHPKLVVVTSYYLEEDEQGKVCSQLVKILDPSGLEVSRLTISTKEGGRDKNIQFLSYFSNLPLKVAGSYKVEIHVDDILIKELTFNVLKR